MKFLDRSLSAEIFPTAQEYRRAKWLNGYLLFGSVCMTVVAVLNLIIANENRRLFGLYFGLLIPLTLFMMMLRRGMVRVVAALVCLLHHVTAFAYIIILAGGIRSPAMIYLLIGIPLVALLFQRRIAIGITFVVCLGMCFTYFLEVNDVIHAQNAMPADFMNFVLLLFGYLAGVVVYFSALYVIADHALLEKEEVNLAYDSMFHHLPIGMYIATPDNQIVRVNEALALMNGYDSIQEMDEVFDGVAGDWYVDPNRYDALKTLLRQNGQLTHFESEVYRPKTKERIWISESVNVVKRRDGSISHFEGTIQDITERKLAEKQLKESREQYRMIADTAVDGILTFTSDGLISFVNPEAGRIFGFERDEIIGRRIDTLLPELANLEGKSEIAQTKSKRMVSWRKSGEAFPIEIALGRGRKNNEFIYTAIIRDITEREKIEKTLEETTAQIQFITDNVPSGIGYLDKDYIIRFSNQFYLESFGKPREETIGFHLSDVVKKERLEKARERLDLALSGKEIKFKDKTDLFNDGIQRDVVGAYVPNIVKGEIEGLFVFIQDVTEQTKTEEALYEAQRLDSLGVLAGGIAHDFNNLLLAMLGQITLAHLKIEDNDPAQINLKKAEKAANRAASLCRQLLAYSGQGHFEVERIDINGMIFDNKELLRVAINKSVTLQTNFSKNLPLVEADKAQIQQVIMNLIINAAEAIGDSIGKVFVKTSQKELVGDEVEYWQWTAQPLPAGSYVSVEIRDTGEGIKKENLQKIFDPFFTTKEKGHGLGLSAVVGIIRGHNGGLLVESDPEVGTTFEILFPVGMSQEPDNHGKIEPVKIREGGINVLVIDDDDAILDLVDDILKTAGYTTTYFSSGEKAIPYFSNSHNKYGLVILDLTLPGLSGVEILTQIKEIDPYIPVIISSGYHYSEAKSRFEDHHPDYFLQKPYSAPELISTVNKFCRSIELA